MLGPYNLLPLLKGWEYKTYETGERRLTRGASIEVIRATNELGWLNNAVLATDDCYAGVDLAYQGSDLQQRQDRVTVQYAHTLGAIGIGADPAGFVQLYYRPVPTSTYGAYYFVLLDLYYGNTLPFLPTVIVQLYLDSTSTQETATVSFSARTINITNRELFIRSLRKVLGSKNMIIDPALLQYGAVMLNQLKGEEWRIFKETKQ